MKNKVLMFYINSIHDGGAERVILEVAHGFSQMGYRCILVTSFVDSHWEYSLPEGVERISMEQEERRENVLTRNIRRIWKLRQLCKYYKPVVLISFMGEPNVRAIIATTGLAVKTIISVRDDPGRYKSASRFYSRYIYPLADGCVFQTQEAKEAFPQKLQAKSIIIFNPVSDIYFSVERNALCTDVVALGRLARQKNYPLLIDAFARVSDKHPRCNLRIYGQGALQRELQYRIDSLGMGTRIHLMGMSNDVPGVLARARLFVLASDWEGLPNALMEAMATGVPCIATDCPCGGPKMLIMDGVTGRLIPMRDVNEMAKVMDTLLSDGDMADKMGQAGRAWGKEHFHRRRIMDIWRRYVEQVVCGMNTA